MLFKKIAIAAAVATTLAFVGCAKKTEEAPATEAAASEAVVAASEAEAAADAAAVEAVVAASEAESAAEAAVEAASEVVAASEAK